MKKRQVKLFLYQLPLLKRNSFLKSQSPANAVSFLYFSAIFKGKMRDENGEEVKVCAIPSSSTFAIFFLRALPILRSTQFERLEQATQYLHAWSRPYRPYLHAWKRLPNICTPGTGYPISARPEQATQYLHAWKRLRFFDL